MAIGTLQYNTEHAHCVSYEYLMKVGIQHDVNSQNWLMFLLVLQKAPSEYDPNVRNHGEGPY